MRRRSSAESCPLLRESFFLTCQKTLLSPEMKADAGSESRSEAYQLQTKLSSALKTRVFFCSVRKKVSPSEHVTHTASSMCDVHLKQSNLFFFFFLSLREASCVTVSGVLSHVFNLSVPPCVYCLFVCFLYRLQRFIGRPQWKPTVCVCKCESVCLCVRAPNCWSDGVSKCFVSPPRSVKEGEGGGSWSFLHRL